jgi:hypothetical protein
MRDRPSGHASNSSSSDYDRIWTSAILSAALSRPSKTKHWNPVSESGTKEEDISA